MADYFTPTVVQPAIPDADMTPLERILLSNIFSAQHDSDGWSFFAEIGPSTMIVVSRTELETALAASADPTSTAQVYITGQLAQFGAHDAEIDLDLSGTSWEFFLQDIVKRSKTLAYITVVSAFTCSKMRPDGFGGMAVLITPDTIMGKSTNDLLEDFLSEARLESSDAASSRGIDAPTAPSSE